MIEKRILSNFNAFCFIFLFTSHFQARAKLELRKDATEQDARDVVELMKHSLLDTFSDELGALDFQRSQNGSGTSSKSQVTYYTICAFVQSICTQHQTY